MAKGNKILKIVGISLGVVAAPTIVVGGYFLIGAADTYRGFYVNPNNDGTTGFLNAYRGSVLQGAKIIMAAGFNHQVPIEQAFVEQGDFYKDTGFMLFDSAVMGNSIASANTWNITYRADLGSLQTGIAAAMFLNEYKDHFATKDDGKLTYAMWGGQPFSSVTSFMGGFQKGVEWANTNVGPAVAGWINVEQITKYANGNALPDFTGGFGPSEGIGLMREIVNLKPDILMPVAGPQIWTADDLIKVSSPKTILIGVDSPVENDPRNYDYPYKDDVKGVIGNGKRIQFSSLKDLALSGQIGLEIINNGNVVPDASNVRYDNFFDTTTGLGGYGTAAVGNIENKCVGVSEPGQSFLTEAEALGAVPIDYTEYNDYTTGWETRKVDGKDTDGQWIPNSMTYIGNGYVPGSTEAYKHLFNYGHPDVFGIQQKFANNLKEGSTALSTKNIITSGQAEDKKLFRIVLSSIGSILMDSSFSQSCYTGLYTYLKAMDIPIPAPVGGVK